jgi:hypothetical protein
MGSGCNEDGQKMRGWMRRRVERQAHLMGAMMERAGIDPADAALRGRAFAAAGRRCLWCAASHQCEGWLGEAGATTLSPPFCPNTEFFRTLAQTQSGSAGWASRISTRKSEC